jgi:hypothetical protein
VEVLRPPTYARLAEVLRNAKARGTPYHIVHFDGHGLYVPIEGSQPQPGTQVLQGWGTRLLTPASLHAGVHGLLSFENPQVPENEQWVDGPALGALLVESGVPLLLLNACRSAYAQAAAPAPAEQDLHDQVRAMGSLAQEVLEQGVPGVVAMRYNTFPVSAAPFLADLYAALAQGATLGEAATRGRKQLAAQPLRTVLWEPRALQDWPVPAVYEAAPLQLCPVPTGEAWHVGATPPHQEHGLPARPDLGFIGRDETLLTLDRALDTQRVVLLHGDAGGGKSATAVEFARWYARTGGVTALLYTSFERYLPLPQVLDQLGQAFEPLLEQGGVHWLALDDGQRRDVALQVLQHVPLLWVWDQAEPVAGLPSGGPSAWSVDEQRALADWLRLAAHETRARFLLTSRRDERAWLGDLPARIALPPLHIIDGVQVARVLAEKSGCTIHRVGDWLPLLDHLNGNPGQIIARVGQALREGVRDAARVQAFLARLRAEQEAAA